MRVADLELKRLSVFLFRQLYPGGGREEKISFPNLAFSLIEIDYSVPSINPVRQLGNGLISL